MSDINSFPKIFGVGSAYIPNLFKGKVEVTEKIDGSQFSFGCTPQGQVVFRSKGCQMYFEKFEKMFTKAVDFVIEKQEILLKNPGWFWYGEFLANPKHNILCYERTPINNIIIFGLYKSDTGFASSYKKLSELANKILGLETVPLLYSGEVKNYEELEDLLKTPSILGKEIVEGIVIKNYQELIVLGGNPQPTFAKYVRESFKEKHQKEWVSGKDKVEIFIDSFRTEARWHKAVQHLKEKGLLISEPKDIGILINEIETDILAEEELNIKEKLYSLFKDQILRKAKAGFPEWYKEQLAKNSFLELEVNK